MQETLRERSLTRHDRFPLDTAVRNSQNLHYLLMPMNIVPQFNLSFKVLWLLYQIVTLNLCKIAAF